MRATGTRTCARGARPRRQSLKALRRLGGGYTNQIRCWQRASHPNPGASLGPHGRAMRPRTLFIGPEALTAHISNEPYHRLSIGDGLRKPRASNSAGAACNGARAVVSTGISPWQRPRFGKGDCNSHPTTPFPGLVENQDWATRARCSWGRPIRTAETMTGAQIDSVQRCAGGGSSRGLYPCLDRHA